eukprot:48495-Prymnesium_polylepis.1
MQKTNTHRAREAREAEGRHATATATHGEAEMSRARLDSTVLTARRQRTGTTVGRGGHEPTHPQPKQAAAFTRCRPLSHVPSRVRFP